MEYINIKMREHRRFAYARRRYRKKQRTTVKFIHSDPRFNGISVENRDELIIPYSD